MTNEEAIRVLEVAKAESEWNAPLEYQVAFDMAIEALKAQPKHDQNTPQKQPDLETLGVKTGETCTDAISRQAAIEEIRIYTTKPNISDDESEIKGYNDGLELAISVLSVLPSVQPEIIHCKDCIHWINKHLCEIWSRYGTIETKPDFYCGFGERINNE